MNSFRIFYDMHSITYKNYTLSSCTQYEGSNETILSNNNETFRSLKSKEQHSREDGLDRTLSDNGFKIVKSSLEYVSKLCLFLSSKNIIVNLIQRFKSRI